MTKMIAPGALKQKIQAREEFAVIDVREEGVFARGHLLFATTLPLSRLELGIRALVPRTATRIALIDGNDGLAERAATILSAGGYSDVTVVEEGIDGCRAAGFELYQGVNVPSKAFGEWVELTCHTPHIAPEALKAKLDRGDKVVMLDTRPYDEYQLMNIPGAISCPSQELLYRLRDVVPDEATPIVVNCAGRTRSIIGAQSLINAGVRNPVVALRDGAMGWQLKGFPLEHKQDRRAPKVSPKSRGDALARAEQVAVRAGVKVIDEATFRAWRNENRRTLYVFDIRPIDEYRIGHRPDAIPVEGVQLVQKTDNYVAVWSARIVLVDDDGVRARTTAAWLAQMGFDDVAVLSTPAEYSETVTGPYRPLLLRAAPKHRTIGPRELAAAIEAGAVTVIDLARSLSFKVGHIPGAWFAIRSRLRANLPRIPMQEHLVVTSDDGMLAFFAAAEIEALMKRPVAVLEGGTRAWATAELPLESGLFNMADAPDDAFWRPYELDQAQESEMQKYLSWEQGLVEQVKRDASVRFRPLTPEAIWAGVNA